MSESLTVQDRKCIQIPEFDQLHLDPFPHHPQDKQQLAEPDYLPHKQILPTFTLHYLRQFEAIAGSENLFPIFIEITCKNIYVCCKDCFIIYPFLENLQELHEVGDHHFEKVNLPQLPTAFKSTTDDILLFGLQSGTIIVYNAVDKMIMTTCEEFEHPVLQIAPTCWGDGLQVLALDEYGNTKCLSLRCTRIMDRMAKYSLHCHELICNYRVRKREKLKKLIKSMPFKSSKTDHSTEGETSEESLRQLDPKNRPKPKFALLSHPVLNPSSHSSSTTQRRSIAYYHNNQLRILVLNAQNSIISEQTLISDITDFNQQKCQQACESTPLYDHLEDPHQEIGLMEIGLGGFKNSNQTHVVLVLSIRNVIHFYRQLDLEETLEFIHISFLVHSQKIYNGCFSSNNLILYCTESGVCISNVNEQPELLYRLNYSKFGYVDFFNAEENFRISKIDIFRNLLKATTNKETGNSHYVCLEGKRIIVGEIYSWHNYLERVHDRYEDWEKCMKSGLMIYNGQLTKLAGISEIIETRNQSMINYFEKISLTYLSLAFKTGAESHNAQAIRTVIDFMVRTEDFEYLFTTIYGLIQQQSHISTFMHELQPYILAGSIKVMTNEALAQTVKYYLDSTTQSNKEIVETLFMNFEMSRMEKSLLLTVCLNHGLYRSLIHICKEQGDFVTPLIKLCGLRSSMMSEIESAHSTTLKGDNEGEKWQNQSCKTQSQTQQCQTEHECQKGQPEGSQSSFKCQTERLSSIIFWYLGECLRGRMTEFNDPEAYLQMLSQLINFMFIPSSLQMLMSAGICNLLKVVNMMFGAKVMQCVMENNHLFKVKNNQYISAEPKSREAKGSEQIQHSDSSEQANKNQLCDNDQPVEEFPQTCQPHSTSSPTVTPTPVSAPPNTNKVLINGIIGQFKIYEDMLCTLIFTVRSSNDPSHAKQLYKFITCLVLKNTLPFALHYKQQAFIFTVNNPQLLVRPQDTASNRSINSLVIRLLDSILYSLKMYHDQPMKSATLSELLNILESSPHVQRLTNAKLYILHELGRQAEVVNVLIRQCLAVQNQSEQHTETIFRYFNENMGKNTYIDDRSGIVAILLSKLPELFAISQSQSMELAVKVSELSVRQSNYQCISDILSHVSKQPLTQLSYIEQMLGLIKEPALREKLLLQHLAIVVGNQHLKLQDYILTVDYPLEAAYKACEQGKNNSAMAYILIRSGRNVEGVYLLTDIFLSTAKQAFRSMAKNMTASADLQKKMNSQLQKVLQTCSLVYANDSVRGQQVWEKVTEKLFKGLNIKNYDKINIPQIKQVLQAQAHQIVYAMFRQVSAQFFIEVFSERLGVGIPNDLYLHAHDVVFGRLQFEYQIKSLTKQSLRSYEYKLYLMLLKLTSAGLSFQPCNCCDVCGVETTVQKWSTLLRYTCGHTFHQKCVCEQQKMCPSCDRNVWDICIESVQQQVFGPTDNYKQSSERYAIKASKVCSNQRQKLAEFDCLSALMDQYLLPEGPNN